MAIGECYLALPNPDANFVPDFQTNNFASRLFELYLIACFREQGLSVRQDYVSPDFQIERMATPAGSRAVTANSETPRAGRIDEGYMRLRIATSVSREVRPNASPRRFEASSSAIIMSWTM